jgi:uncharacterized protein
MTISMHNAMTPVFLRMFANLDAMLDKLETDAKARNYSPEVVLNARLAPDMLPLIGQVQRASDTAKGAIARLSGAGQSPSMPDTETSVADLRIRIAKTVDYIKSVPASAIDGSAEREVVLKTPNGDLTWKGLTYLTGFVLPNFLFHITTAYAILRHNGVQIGKMDYLGRS